ncbi:MAG: hypothetical protein IAF08_05155 [Rhizobacter sp.]|nr:hypothetical protein [Chlorobiales bacterium]
MAKKTVAAAEALTAEEWQDLHTQISELYDITIRYTELISKADNQSWERDRPKFVRKKNQPIDMALSAYQKTLDAFEAERKAAQGDTYKKVKADGFDRVAAIDKYIERLAALTGQAAK